MYKQEVVTSVEQHVVSNSDEIKDVINIIQVAPECTKI